MTYQNDDWKCAGCGKPGRVRSCDCPTNVVVTSDHITAWKHTPIKEAPETMEVDGVWYDRRDTVDALTTLLAEARQKIATYKEVIRGFRMKELAEKPPQPPQTARHS